MLTSDDPKAAKFKAKYETNGFEDGAVRPMQVIIISLQQFLRSTSAWNNPIKQMVSSGTTLIANLDFVINVVPR